MYNIIVYIELVEIDVDLKDELVDHFSLVLICQKYMHSVGAEHFPLLLLQLRTAQVENWSAWAVDWR